MLAKMDLLFVHVGNGCDNLVELSLDGFEPELCVVRILIGGHLYSEKIIRN